MCVQDTHIKLKVVAPPGSYLPYWPVLTDEYIVYCVFLQLYWQRMPDEGPELPLEPAPVEELVYDEAPERLSDAEDQ